MSDAKTIPNVFSGTFFLVSFFLVPWRRAAQHCREQDSFWGLVTRADLSQGQCVLLANVIRKLSFRIHANKFLVLNATTIPGHLIDHRAISAPFS